LGEGWRAPADLIFYLHLEWYEFPRVRSGENYGPAALQRLVLQIGIGSLHLLQEKWKVICGYRFGKRLGLRLKLG
jgi:hypothetical protein